MAVTRHRIYTVLDVPTAPWTHTPFNPTNTQLPWAAALDRACDWVRGATAKDQAAKLITESIYALGPAVVQYDCPGGGASHVNFDCIASSTACAAGWATASM